MFDLDDFKRINDRIGHLAGDAVLAEVAARLRSVVRSTDIACRVGGDEFAVILPESTRDDAEHLADRIERAVSSEPIAKSGTLKISAGVAELSPDDTSSDLFKRADEDLYRAKAASKRSAARDPLAPIQWPCPRQKGRLDEPGQEAPDNGKVDA